MKFATPVKDVVPVIPPPNTNTGSSNTGTVIPPIIIPPIIDPANFVFGESTLRMLRSALPVE